MRLIKVSFAALGLTKADILRKQECQSLECLAA